MSSSDEFDLGLMPLKVWLGPFQPWLQQLLSHQEFSLRALMSSSDKFSVGVVYCQTHVSVTQIRSALKLISGKTVRDLKQGKSSMITNHGYMHIFQEGVKKFRGKNKSEKRLITINESTNNSSTPTSTLACPHKHIGPNHVKSSQAKQFLLIITPLLLNTSVAIVTVEFTGLLMLLMEHIFEQVRTHYSSDLVFMWLTSAATPGFPAISYSASLETKDSTGIGWPIHPAASNIATFRPGAGTHPES